MNIIRTLSMFIMATLISSNAVAEGQTLSEKLANSEITVSVNVEGCNADAAILCPGLPLNSQKAFMCLMAYEDNLSVNCKLGIIEAAMALETGMLAIDYSIKACEADANKYCMDVEPGEGRIISCLRKHESDLNKECTTALKETGFWELGAR